MWRLITIFAIVLAGANASGQGKIRFGNDSAHLFYLYFREPLPISPLPDGWSFEAALYAGTTSSSLNLQTRVALDSSGMLSPGRMLDKNIILSIPGGAPAYFKIFILNTGASLPSTIDGNVGPHYFSGAIHAGTSGLFTAIPGTSISYPHIATGASSTWPPAIIHIGCLECVPPWFLTNPSNSVVNLGNNVTLNAVAVNFAFPAISYQWRKQSVPITGATSNHLTLNNVTLINAGNYDVIASNEFGATLSAIATVTVRVPVVLDSPVYNANNQFQFTVAGAPGTNYVVQVSTNLSNPDWLSVFTNPAPFTFVDSNTVNIPHRFYRAYSP